VIRDETVSAAMARVRSFLDGEAKPSKPETRALFLLAAGGRLAAPKKTSLGAAHEHATKRRAAEDDAELAAKRAMHDGVWRLNILRTSSTTAPHGRCDNPDCQKPFRHFDDGDCDHWIERSQGGEHTVDNGWRLCRECHTDKDGPDRAEWNQRRKTFCELVRIPFVPRREK
jgi:hypothetical protein